MTFVCSQRQIAHSVTFCIMKFSVRSCRTQKSFSPFEYISVLIHIPLTRLLPHTDAASSESYQGSRLKQLKQMHCLVQSFLFWLGMRLGQFRERLKSGAEHNCVSICCSNCLILWRERSGLKCSFNQEKALFRIIYIIIIISPSRAIWSRCLQKHCFSNNSPVTTI